MRFDDGMHGLDGLKGDSMKKQQKEQKTLKLHKETVRLLERPELQGIAAGIYSGSCFPDICIELDSSGC